jgi:hypothetical protein
MEPTTVGVRGVFRSKLSDWGVNGGNVMMHLQGKHFESVNEYEY